MNTLLIFASLIDLCLAYLYYESGKTDLAVVCIIASIFCFIGLAFVIHFTDILRQHGRRGDPGPQSD